LGLNTAVWVNHEYCIGKEAYIDRFLSIISELERAYRNLEVVPGAFDVNRWKEAGMVRVLF